MRIFITGASGYIGGAIAEAAREAAHEVLALAHTPDIAEQLRSRGFTPVAGDLRRFDTLAAIARTADATIHAGFVAGPEGADIDRDATYAMVRAMHGTGHPFIYTSGVWVLGATGATPAHEHSPRAPIALVAWRDPLEQWLVDAAARGAHAVIVRPGIAFGHGGGIPGNLARGAFPLPGDGRQRWSVVHVDDLASLYLAAVEHAQPGAILHGVGAVIEAAELVRAEATTPPALQLVALDVARTTLGDFAEALALEHVVESDHTRAAVGWIPQRLTVPLLTD